MDAEEDAAVVRRVEIQFTVFENLAASMSFFELSGEEERERIEEMRKLMSCSKTPASTARPRLSSTEGSEKRVFEGRSGVRRLGLVWVMVAGGGRGVCKNGGHSNELAIW